MKSPLPKVVKTKIYKTGQTRGADDDVIFQNRVNRNSTVLIPFHEFEKCKKSPTKGGIYENGYIVLISPEDYFKPENLEKCKKWSLRLGTNLLIFYETREQWQNYPPKKSWNAASSRQSPLKGQYVARIPATTAENQGKIIMGFNTSQMKGAGIRVYEYADTKTIEACKTQLELLFWSCKDIDKLIDLLTEFKKEEINQYIKNLSQRALKEGLYEKEMLIKARIIDNDGFTICPLCLKHISAISFCSKIQQAEGREVPDLTVTEVSLFHIKELRSGEFNHRPYNLGWGHHHCNVVVKDSGIEETLKWMRAVLERNGLKIFNRIQGKDF